MPSTYRLWLVCLVLCAASLEEVRTFCGSPGTIVVFGDSLSSGFGMVAEKGWISLLQTRLTDRHWPQRVVNASTPNLPVRRAVEEFPAILSRFQPSIVVLQLGGLDGLSAQPIEAVTSDLSQMIRRAQQAQATVLLVGVRIPGGGDNAYADSFASMYSRLAATHRIPVVEHLLDGVSPSLMQLDGIHPSAAAQPILLENVWRSLEPMLAAVVRVNDSHD